MPRRGGFNDDAFVASDGGGNCPVDGGGGEAAVVILGLAPEEVADQLDEEGVASGGCRCLVHQVRVDGDPGGGEGFREGCLDIAYRGGMEIDLVGSAKECCHALVQEIRYGRGKACKDQCDGQPVLDEVLDVGRQLASSARSAHGSRRR